MSQGLEACRDRGDGGQKARSQTLPPTSAPGTDALHPQTMLAYGMNGRPLPVPHGGPLRLRVDRQVGYKSLKHLERIEVTDAFVDHGKAGNIQNGWAWYVGI